MIAFDIITLSIVAESVQLKHKYFLCSKLNKDYLALFKGLFHPIKLNKIRKRLIDFMNRFFSDLSYKIYDILKSQNQIIPTLEIVREKTSNACRHPKLNEESTKWDISLTSPFQRSQKDFAVYDLNKKIAGRAIEFYLAQYVDEFYIRCNYAKRFEGTYTIIVIKEPANPLKRLPYSENDRSINQSKHALAA